MTGELDVLREALNSATTLRNFAGRYLAGDSDVLPEDVAAAAADFDKARRVVLAAQDSRPFRTAPMKDGIRYDSRGEPVAALAAPSTEPTGEGRDALRVLVREALEDPDVSWEGVADWLSDYLEGIKAGDVRTDRVPEDRMEIVAARLHERTET